MLLGFFTGFLDRGNLVQDLLQADFRLLLAKSVSGQGINGMP